MKSIWIVAVLAGCSVVPADHTITINGEGEFADAKPPIDLTVRLVGKPNAFTCLYRQLVDWNSTQVAGKTLWLPVRREWTEPCRGDSHEV